MGAIINNIHNILLGLLVTIEREEGRRQWVLKLIILV